MKTEKQRQNSHEVFEKQLNIQFQSNIIKIPSDFLMIVSMTCKERSLLLLYF